MQSNNTIPGVPNTPSGAIRTLSEIDPYFPEKNFIINGVTKDASGNPLAGCTVYLFNMCCANAPLLSQTQISDASGNYSFVVDKTLTWWVLSYKSGSPDVTGASVNTLVGA